MDRAGVLAEVVMRSEMSVRRQALKDALLAERERLIQELSAQQTIEHENPGYGNHMAEEATLVFEQATALALRQRLQRSLGEVEHALNKIAAGSYGQCESCGENIDPARLETLPQARMCMKCQTRVELSTGR